ncbi:MAG: sulfotransferase [Henriciella sp.]|nr:sulfotransferase [Henriciella sp.]
MNGATPLWVNLSVSISALGVFWVGLSRTDWKPRVQRVIESCSSGVSAIFDSDMSDEEKERTVRSSGGALLVSAFGSAWRVLAALWSAALPLVLADYFGWAETQHVFGVMLSIEFILGTTLGSALIYIAWKKLWLSRKTPQSCSKPVLAPISNPVSPLPDIAPEPHLKPVRATPPIPIHDTDPEPRNSSGDQLVHSIAFSAPWVMKSLASLDDMAGSKLRASVPELRPIFITSLARAGTTALLNALHSIPGLAAHQYCDMPFVTTPYLWSKLGGRRRVSRQFRAHGDGLEIDLNSPEAFDEVLWKLYWPEKYEASRIYMWTMVDIDSSKIKRLTENYKKIAALRSGDHARCSRYNFVSKNNANIARLSVLATAFPTAKIVIPIRRPGPHAESLHRQHLNFSEQHAQDPFTKRYMRDIGHFEFGALHRPIQFAGQSSNRYKPKEVNYWLNYWVAAFREVARYRDKCVFVTQDSLRAEPERTMQALTQTLKLDGSGRAFKAFFKAGPDTSDESAFDPDLLATAHKLYDALAKRAVRPTQARLLTGAEIREAAENIL